MLLSKPIWSSTNKSWTIIVEKHESISYSEIRDPSGNDFFDLPDTSKEEFQEVFLDLTKKIIEYCKSHFSTPIKENIFMKRAKNTFQKVSSSNIYGNKYLITWKPNKIIINSSDYELLWDIEYISLENKISSYETLESNNNSTINIIEANEELKEIETLDNVSLQNNIHNSSRAIFKKKVREARLRAAIATMKAERMASKYFRRYGNELDLSVESDLSSDGEDSPNDTSF
jgi:hypothetical protein